MSSLTLKYTATIICSLIVGGVISISAYRYLGSVEKAASQSSPPSERKVLFWYDPMKPDTKFDKPGKSPFMDMDLVPKYADEEHAAAGAPGVRIDPTQTQNLGVKTAAVTRGPLRYAQTFPANISYNEYQYVIMQARAAGFINKVYPLTVGDKVQQGTPLLELTIPDWVEAQSEYLLLQETGGTATQVEGILERLRLAGMPDDDIRRLAGHAGQAAHALRHDAEAGGHVAQRCAGEGGIRLEDIQRLVKIIRSLAQILCGIAQGIQTRLNGGIAGTDVAGVEAQLIQNIFQIAQLVAHIAKRAGHAGKGRSHLGIALLRNEVGGVAQQGGRPRTVRTERLDGIHRSLLDLRVR